MSIEILKILIYAILIMKIKCFIFEEVRIEKANSIIRQTTTYVITLNRQTDEDGSTSQWDSQIVLASANITITFPIQYTNIADVSCSELFVNEIKVTLNFQCLKQGNIVTIRNFLAINAYIKSVKVSINNIINPSPAGITNTFGGSIGNDIAKNSGITQLQPGSFDTCEFKFNGVTGNTTGPFEIFLIFKANIPSSSYIKILFPSFWSTDLASQPITFLANENCESTQASNIICTGHFSVQGPYIKVINAIDSTSIVASFIISNIRAPLTNQPINSIKVATYTQNDQIYDQCDSYPIGVIERLLPSISAIPLSTPFTNSLVQLNISMTFSDTISNITDEIIIDFSSSYSPTISYSELNGDIIFIEALSNSVKFKTRTIKIKDSVLEVNMKYFYTAPSVYQLTPFLVQVYRNNYLLMKGQFNVDIQIGEIKDVSLIPSSYLIKQSAEYTLSFIYNPGITSYGAIRIYFPQQYFILPSSLEAYIGSNKLTSTIINNGIQLTQLIPSTGTIQIVLKNLTNPNRTSPLIFPLQIKIYYNSTRMDEVAQTFDSSSIIQLTYFQISGLVAAVSTSSDTTSSEMIDLIFQIDITVPLLVNDKIVIDYDGIQLVSVNDIDALLLQACYLNTNILQSCYLSIIAPTNQLIVQLNIDILVTHFQLKIRKLFNNPAITTALIANFQVKTTTSDDYTLQTSFNSVYLPAIIFSSKFEHFYLKERTNLMNSELSNYIFVIQQKSTLLSGTNRLIFVFPNQLSISQATCSSCTIDISTRKIIMILSNSQPIDDGIQITIQNIRNPPSTQPFQAIQLGLTLNSTFNYSNNYKLDFVYSNKYPALLDIVSSSYSTGQYGKVTSLLLLFDNIHSQADYAEINIASQFQPDLNGQIVCSIIDPSRCTIVNETLILDVKSLTTINFQIDNLLAPYQISPVRIQISTFSQQKYLISQNTIPQWQPTCQLPCRTCSNDQQCLSCYRDQKISSKLFYNPDTLQCLDVCLDDQLANFDTYQCQDCATGCMRCETTVDNCLQCQPPNLLHNSVCQNSCPSGFFENLDIYLCQTCQFPCKQCSDLDTCINCVANYYLNGTNCIQNCPGGTTIPNNVDPSNLFCQPCSPSCLTCQTTITFCTNCHENKALENGQCLDQCSGNRYIFGGKCVSNCQAPCVTCQKLATRCLSCSPSMFYFNFYCLSSCPETYYQSPGTCSSCSEVVGLNCNNCQDDLTCISCDNGFLFFPTHSSCIRVEDIPSGYINFNGRVIPCTDDCLQCSIITSNCTSCKTNNYHNGFCITNCPISHYKLDNKCIRCLSPCNTCEDSTNCLTCLNTFYLQPNLKICLMDCPIGFYPFNSSKICATCNNQCTECVSQTQCQSCSQNFYLHQSSCLSICPLPYYIQNQVLRICQLCQSPCQRCLNAKDSCTSCISGYYFYNLDNTCLLECPVGYIKNYIEQVCTNCIPPCLVCDQTICFRCSNTYALYQSECYQNCPSNYYPKQIAADNSFQCELCPVQCITCLNNTFCLECQPNYYQIQLSQDGKCILQCPPERPITDGNTCNPCSQVYCINCYKNDQCYECLNSTILWIGQCLNECPIGYAYNQSIQTCELQPPEIQNITNATYTLPPFGEIVQPPFPMICSITAGFFTIITVPLILCKWCGQKILIAGVLATIWGIAESGALTMASYAFYKFHMPTGLFQTPFIYLLLITLLIIFLLNIVVVFLNYFTVIMPDNKYRRWKGKSDCSSISIVYFGQILSFVNYKSVHLMWSNIKGSPQLQYVGRLKFISFISAIGCIASLIYTITAIFLIIETSELLLVWIDAIVASIVAVLFSMCALRRPQQFFQQKLDGISLHKRHISSDEFIANILKGDQRTQSFVSRNEKQQIESSYLQIQSSNRYIESSIEISNRQIDDQITNSYRQTQTPRKLSFSSLQSFSSERSSKKLVESKVASINKKQISLQCSILPMNDQSGEYYSYQQKEDGSQCIYEESDAGNMGSIDQSKSWNGVPMGSIQYRQQYDLNQAVILDQDGNLVDMQDYSSDEAVVSESIINEHSNSIQQQFKQQLQKGQKYKNQLKKQQQQQKQQHKQQIQIQQHKQQQKRKNQQKQHKEEVIFMKSGTKSLLRNESQILNQSKINKNQQKQKQKQQDTKQQNNPKYTQYLQQRLSLIKNKEVNNNNQNQDEFNQQIIQNNVKQDNAKNNQKQIKENYEDDQEYFEVYKTVLESNNSQQIKMKDSNSNSKLQIQKQMPELSFQSKNKTIHNFKQQQQQQQQILSQKQSDQQRDRFDNSIISNHQGSIGSQELEDEISGVTSNNDGSLEEAKNIRDQNIKQLKEKQIKDKQKQQEEKYKLDQSDSVENPSLHYDTTNIDAFQQEIRWKQLLQQQNQQFIQNQNIPKNEEKESEKQIKQNSSIQKQNEGSDGSQGRNRYLQSVNMKNQIQQQQQQNQAKQEEGNQFRIKTKKKKKSKNPRQRVLVVESRKFSSLKRQASQLQKQIKKGDLIKNKIEQGPKIQLQNNRLSRANSLSKLQGLKSEKMQLKIKEDKLRAIYLRNQNFSPKKND